MKKAAYFALIQISYIKEAKNNTQQSISMTRLQINQRTFVESSELYKDWNDTSIRPAV